MKQWVLRHDRFIGETVQDESGMRARLPHERSGLVRLGWLALGPIPGGVLLDNRDDLGDARSRAVVFHDLAEKGVDVWYRHGTRPVIQAIATTVRHSRDEAGRATFEEDLAVYRQAVRQHMDRQMTTSGFWAVVEDLNHLGSGPLRDAEMVARTCAYVATRAPRSVTDTPPPISVTTSRSTGTPTRRAQSAGGTTSSCRRYGATQG
jgi:hypothetical protein